MRTNITSFNFGGRVTYQCNSGYAVRFLRQDLVPGQSRRSIVCQNAGQWTAKPMCVQRGNKNNRHFALSYISWKCKIADFNTSTARCRELPSTVNCNWINQVQPNKHFLQLHTPIKMVAPFPKGGFYMV